MVQFFVLAHLCYAQTPKLDAYLSINELIDNWHLAATNADFDGYFNAIHDEGRFLGTDKTERWSKEEFKAFAKDPFASKRTWDFKPSARKIFISEDLRFAWFDEVLETWMGPCRGSGVLKKTDSEWKIMQYNLAILVDNLLVADYLELVKKKKKADE